MSYHFLDIEMSSDASNDFSHDLDTTITFRVNSELKEEFAKLCKVNYSDTSKELNKSMRKAVSKKKLDIDNMFF